MSTIRTGRYEVGCQGDEERDDEGCEEDSEDEVDKEGDEACHLVMYDCAVGWRQSLDLVVFAALSGRVTGGCCSRGLSDWLIWLERDVTKTEDLGSHGGKGENGGKQC